MQNKLLFENHETGLTAGALKIALENVPDDMLVCVRTLTEFFPAERVELGTYKLYPPGCNGVAQGKKECIRIE